MCFLPLIVQPPVVAYAATMAGSYEALHAPLWWAQWGAELVFMSLAVTLAIVYGSHAARAHAAELMERRRLVEQTLKAQGLLETAMPPHIVQALIARREAWEMAESGKRVAIAFIRLSDYATLTRQLSHEALFAWLDKVYAAFDAIVGDSHDTSE